MFCGAAVDTQKHADAKQNVGGAWLIPTRSRAVKKVGTTHSPLRPRRQAPFRADLKVGTTYRAKQAPFRADLITFAKATGVKKVGIA